MKLLQNSVQEVVEESIQRVARNLPLRQRGRASTAKAELRQRAFHQLSAGESHARQCEQILPRQAHFESKQATRLPLNHD